MAKIIFQPMPVPPKVYVPQYQHNLVRLLQQSLQRVNYATESDAQTAKTMSWLGF